MELGASFAFRLRQVQLGEDHRGRPVTSCVVAPAKIEIQLTKTEMETTEILKSLVFEASGPTVTVASWREGVMSRPELLPGQTRDVKRKQWQRLLKGLEKKRIIELFGKQVGLRSG